MVEFGSVFKRRVSCLGGLPMLYYFEMVGTDCKIKIHFPQIIGIEQKMPFFLEINKICGPKVENNGI